MAIFRKQKIYSENMGLIKPETGAKTRISTDCLGYWILVAAKKVFEKREDLPTSAKFSLLQQVSAYTFIPTQKPSFGPQKASCFTTTIKNKASLF